MNFPSIDVQGSILSTDLLAKIRSEEATFQQGKDFHPDYTNAKLKDEISLAWQEAKGQWTIFKSKLTRLKEGETGTTETRNFWISPLLTNLGYNLTFNRTSEELNGKSFPIGYRDGSLDNFPVYVGGYHESLDKRPENKQLRVSPHAMLQEYLNYSEHLYGLVTNGRQLRLLRDASRITRLSYVEFNLEKMMEEDLYSDFVILYRVLHASRMPKKIDQGAESIIEKYHQEGLAAGSTIRSKLGDAVKEAIKSLANGFINHPNNTTLREAVVSGNFNADEYYCHQLRIIYRLLFLFVIEERNLVYADNKTPEAKRYNYIYFNYYSLLRLRKLAKKLLSPEASRHFDLWQGLISTFSLFEKKEIGEKLGIMALQGDLFGCHAISGNGYDLHQCYLSNAVLLNIIKSLSYFENDNGVLIAVNYGGLDVEEFGSVYEGLLELKLELKKIEGSDQYSCSFDTSNERGKSGSHYTPEELVQPLIKHSLEYLIQDRLDEGKRMANGEWRMVVAKYPVIQTALKNLIINLSLEYEKLSGIGSVAKGNGFGTNDLPINQLFSQRRIVWDDFSAPQIGKFHSGKHSRGLGAKQQQGIHTVSEHSQGQLDGNGNTPAAGSKNQPLQTGADKPDVGNFSNPEQAASILATFHLSEKQLSQIWNHLPLAIRHSLFTTHHLLNLKIADVACGSGHILLSAARRLSLEIARVQTEEEQPNPVAIRKAMKDVVRNCIYGVDKNPLAVELCKIALWLEAYNPGEPLNFLDHHIKCGDAIVGLAHRSELENGIADEAFKTLPGDDKDIVKTWRDKNGKERKERAAKALQLKAEFEKSTENSVQEAMAEYKTFSQLPETTSEEIVRKAKAYQKFIDGKGFTFLKAMADTQVAQFFIPKTEANKDYLMTDADYRLILSGYKGWQDRKVAKATAVAHDQRFFHWFIEFPEVFNEGGFDAILGNPPFLGGKKISTILGVDYNNWIKSVWQEKGSSDLVGFFFRRAFDIIKINGFQSLITTNTICQGDTREVALDVILNNGGKIIFAIKSMKWPGLAAVEVSLISITKGEWSKQYFLNGKKVEHISSHFEDVVEIGTPFQLIKNSNKSFKGVYVFGPGFILNKEESIYLKSKDEKNKEVIFPYLIGEDFNGSPDQTAQRDVINFFDWPEEKARKYIDCFKIVEEKVKPQRDEFLKTSNQIHEYSYWKYWDKRPFLTNAISGLNKVLVSCTVSKHLSLAFVASNQVFDIAVNIIAYEEFSKFGILQSNIHSAWAWKYGSTMKTDLRYTPSSCIETFTFPPSITSETEQQLDRVSEVYHEHRRQLMLGMQLGLTKTYNLFHSNAITAQAVNDKDKQVAALQKHLEKTPNTISFNKAIQGILKLRELHVQMDEAVLAAYGWGNDEFSIKNYESKGGVNENVIRNSQLKIDLRHDFYEVDYLPENDRIRFTIHPDARKEVLKRLLELNHKIHEEEVKAGLWDKKKASTKKANTVNEPNAAYGGDLFNQE
jgi:hypothetical protein